MSEPSLQEQLAAIRVMTDQLDAWSAAIYQASLAAPDAEKVCEDRMANMLADPPHRGGDQFPMTLHGITWKGDIFGEGWRGSKDTGRFVSVRPCAKEYEKKTFLGVLVGELSIHRWCAFDAKNGILQIHQGGGNPTIWVPELKRCILGCESWWGFLKKPEDLKAITDADIESVWYVQAIQSLTSTNNGEPT